jgi:hypothetical protein
MSRRLPLAVLVHIAGVWTVLPGLFLIGAAAAAPTILDQPAGMTRPAAPGLGGGARAHTLMPEPATIVLPGAGVIAVVVVRRCD